MAAAGASLSSRKQDAEHVAALSIDYMRSVIPTIADVMHQGALRKQALDRAALARFDADDKHLRPPYEFRVGDRVVLHGTALNGMGVSHGGDVERVWTVLECCCDLCDSGRFVCTDQVSAYGPRHIAKRGLRLECQSSEGDANATGKIWACGSFKDVSYPPSKRLLVGISAVDADAEARVAYLAAEAAWGEEQWREWSNR